MFCTQCGSDLKENKKFCTNCGASVQATISTPASYPTVPPPPSAKAGRQSAFGSSPAPATVAARVLPPGRVATAEVPETVRVVPVTPLNVPGETDGFEETAARRAVSPLLMVTGIGTLALSAVAAVFLFLRSSPPPSVPDTQIEKSILEKFAADSNISKCTVQVRSQLGVVTLTGLVNKTSDRSTADNIARQQAGVKTVVDNLVLPGPTSATTGRPEGPPKLSPTASAPGNMVSVPGNQAWTATGLFLTAGTIVQISASGGVSMGAGWPLMPPSGKQSHCKGRSGFPAPYLPCWSLIGRVGEQGPIFYIGSGTTLRVAKEGQLLLGVNDDRLEDNSGNWIATVAVKTTPFSTEAERATWLGFANGNVAQDRDEELRRNCGDFKRAYVPDNVGNDFTDLCRYMGKTCEKVCDWEGRTLSCEAISQGANRDGTRVADCR